MGPNLAKSIRRYQNVATVTIEGIYSEFPAILNLSLLFPSSAPLRAGYDFTKYTKLPAIPGPNFALYGQCMAHPSQ